MRVKTSITLPDVLLRRIDRVDANRSAFIERASRWYLDRMAKQEREAKDLVIIESNADWLNAEALDVLDYQGQP